MVQWPELGLSRDNWTALGLQAGIVVADRGGCGRRRGAARDLGTGPFTLDQVVWRGYLPLSGLRQWRAAPMDMSITPVGRPIGRPLNLVRAVS